MTRHSLHRWDDASIRQVYDSVLAYSVHEFRQALALLDRNGTAAEGHYVQQLREALHVTEREMRRRGLDVDDDASTSPHGRRSDAVA